MTTEPEEEAEEAAPPSSPSPEEEEEAKDEAEAPPPAAVPAPENWGYPAFARNFPRDEALDGLVEAFARGDYLAVRDGVPKLLAREELAEDVKEAALLLRERTEPDRTARVFFYLAAALLVLLTSYWLAHNGPEHRVPPPATPPPAPEIIKN